MTGVEVRRVDFEEPAECDAVLDLLDMYSREELHGGTPLAPDVRERLPRGLAEEPGAVVFLAWKGGSAVGVAVCFRRYSSFAAAPLLNVHDVAVRPELRGQGIGRQMLDAAEGHARSIGCCRLTLEVLEQNTGARALYRSFGFDDVPDGEEGKRTFFLGKVLE